MKRKVIYWGVAAMLCIGVVYSCSKGSSNSPTNTSPTKTTPVAANSVQIQGYAFSPASITVKVGTTVTWTNKDAVAHTVTDLAGSFDSGSVGSNATYKNTFATPGTYTYHCTIHPMMADAKVVVTN